jgi:hypothetical protein
MLFAKRGRQEVEEEDKLQLKYQGELNLRILGYDDLFSNFDSRPYDVKQLSDDFLIEAKRATRDKHGIYEVNLLVPKSKRDRKLEETIKKRLKDHFKRHYRISSYEIKATERKGAWMGFLGVLLIFISAYLETLHSTNLMIAFVQTLFEPAGWFTAWTGLDLLFYNVPGKKPEREFYKKMADANISFGSY